MKKTKADSRERIHHRIKKKVKGTAEKPRLSLYRSNKGIYCQLINDVEGRVITSASFKHVELTDNMTKIEHSKEVGKALASKAKEANVTKIVFDRSGYLYHGRVKALADGAREGGLEF